MKSIELGMKYEQHNKELGHTLENKGPVIVLKPDSALLKDEDYPIIDKTGVLTG